MKATHIIIILYLLAACGKSSHQVDSDNFSNEDAATWITDRKELPKSDSLFYLDHPAPLFRKNFKARNEIESAKLYITAAGYYIASLNGSRVGKNILDPAWTDYSKRIYYTVYDVTPFVQEGENCLGVSLGNSFYNPLPLRKWGRRNLRTDTKVGKPAFRAKLVITYADGNKEETITDESWKYAYGPILKNSVYIGVAYDARKNVEGWTTWDFDDNEWLNAVKDPGPGGILQKTFFPPVQVTEEIVPLAIMSPNRNVNIVDMGVNFTGTYRIKVRGRKGDKINFRFGERIYEDGTLNPMTSVIGQIKRKGVGGPGAPDIAWQEDSYIIGDEAEAWFTPDFTYHTYRYMEISGLTYKPEIFDIRGLAINSNVWKSHQFSCSSDLLNSIQEAVERTFLSNLVSVQSDCPAREKFGYGGDLNATAESFIYNFDMQSFYRKTIYDWVDAMNDSSFVDTAPFVGISYCGISWESAFLTTQFYLYLYYNDIEIVRELYELNKQWMKKAAAIHPNGLVEKGLSDHESLQPVPVQLTGTTHYLQCAEIMSLFADLMDDQEQQQIYAQLAAKLRNEMQEAFWDTTMHDPINRQTLFATLLNHNVIPENQRAAGVDSLVNAVAKGPSGHFNTGIFGTKFALEALSSSGLSDKVYDIVSSTEYPGWGHMIDRGATTIWETWKESDNIYSNNHPMFGTVTEWFYRWLAGIKPMLAYPGFKQFIIEPFVPEDLKFVNCSYTSPFGQIVSNWKKDDLGNCQYEFEVPKESTAHVKLDIRASDNIEIVKNEKFLDLAQVEGIEKGEFSLSPGHYIVNISNQ